MVESLALSISVRSVQGHAYLYRSFIKDFLRITHLLWKLFKKEIKFEFDDACLRAFEKMKEKLTSALIIISSDWDNHLKLCDASGALGVVLEKRWEKMLHPIYYTRKALNLAQKTYTITELVFLVVVFTFEVKTIFKGESGI